MFAAPVRAMPFDGQTLATQPTPVLQPPRPPGRPPTLTAIGLAPELPDPELAAAQLDAASAAKTTAMPRVGLSTDRILAAAAAGAALAAALGLWAKVLVTALH